METIISWAATLLSSGEIIPGYTFNAWWGCFKISPGCKNCYAERFAVQRLGKDIWGPVESTHRQTMSDAYWRSPIAWNRLAEQDGVRRRVFCGSMCDVFEDHPDVLEARSRLWHIIDSTPHLDWLLLTKRPDNIEKFLPNRWVIDGLPRNVWFGVSAENQYELVTRWPVLESFARAYHPAVTFLSLEPLLEAVDLSVWLEEIDLGDEDHSCWQVPPSWVIVGGESGPGCRPFNEEWAIELREQCMAAGVPFFFKQHGGTAKVEGVWGGDKLQGQRFHAWPDGMRMDADQTPVPPGQLRLF